MKKLLISSSLLCSALCLIWACTPPTPSEASGITSADTASVSNKPAVLVFYKTTGWKHASIPHGRTALHLLGQQNGFTVDTTANDAVFTRDNLKKYGAVVFLSTSKEVLNQEQQQAFEDFIKSGGGFMGIHGAADTEYNWAWYNQLLGAQFESHPKNQTAMIRVTDKNHPSTRHLPDNWERFDEWYNFQNLQPNLNVLAQLDESTYEGGKHGNSHPIAWYQEFQGSRSFYTAFGHTPESYSEPLFLQHLLGGLQWVLKQE